ncbi:MAG: beta-galactosidase, partial [Promethearchaeota archaeon]
MDGVRIGEFSWSRLEPKEGVFDFDWLDKAIKILGDAGLKVIIGTPTATPPSWLVHKHPEILPVNANGIVMKSGVRKYYCHSNEIYRKYANIIATKLSQHFGRNLYVVGWQIDNELGDHDTVRCYCSSCRNTFISWCKEKYKDLELLNIAWGTVFWSQEYSEWDQLDLPYPQKEIGLNPSHLLDYYRFASDQVVEFCENQIRPLRKNISKEQWITTNIIATYWEIDFHKLAKNLDFIS